MKHIRNISACALLLASSLVSEATTYTASNWHGAFLTQGASETGSFDISSSYDHNTEQIDSASITFTFLDDTLNDVIVVGRIFGFPIFGQEGEAGDISLDGNRIASESGNFWIFAGFTYGISGNVLVGFSNTGILSYEIKSTLGDFWFKSATLTAESSEREVKQPQNPVPDSATTVVLLGASLLGLGLLRRRFAK